MPIRFSLAVLLLFVCLGCGSVPDRNAVPPEFGETAKIPGIPEARFWGDVAPERAARWNDMSDEEVQRAFSGVLNREHSYLAISGGGSDGAFTAGLLNGWTAKGDRPEFTMVTGISTGALIAPFAFLGPAYDDYLANMYTTITTEQILEKRALLRGLTSDALADSTPLQEIIAGGVDEEFLEKVAVEHRRGRRLLIGTTNLDAARPVIWDMGEIAASGKPRALELFRSVMLASASIPGAFPPVLIPVRADGKTYDEVHVDGGVTTQVFLLPTGFEWDLVKKKLGVRSTPRIYVIRNSRVDPMWKSVELAFGTLVGRTISSLIRTQGLGDLFRIWIDAKENGLDYNLAYVPKSFELEAEDVFDPQYMKALYDVAYDAAKQGYPWKKAPPGMEAE